VSLPAYLIDEAAFRLLVEPGYATVPQLLKDVAAAEVDAVLISHGHADHCADLNPLLRARHLSEDPRPRCRCSPCPALLMRCCPRRQMLAADLRPSGLRPR